MNRSRLLVPALLLALSAAGRADDRQPPAVPITDRTFRQVSALLTDDPLNKSADRWARLILLYTTQTSAAAVAVGPDELRWVGRPDRRGLLLLAAYASGNIQSQLNSGVKRNDRYSGLLALFRVYRALGGEDDKFKIDEVDALLRLHREGGLMKYVLELDEKRPARPGAADEEAIRRFLRGR